MPDDVPRSLRLPATDGLTLHALEWSTEGVPLLFLHGFGNDAHIWDDFAPVVAPHYRTLALDHRGHGDSDWSDAGRYGYDSLADDVEAVTNELGIERLVLIGHSLGGRVSTLFASRHPERMAGLVLVDIGPELDARGTTRIRMEAEQQQNPSFGSIEEYARTVSLLYPASPPEVVMRLARHGVRQGEDGRYVLKMDPLLRGMTREGAAEPELREGPTPEEWWEALAKIPCPTLVVRGAASDVLAPDTADRMVDDVLPNGHLAVVPQASHSVMTDNPSGFRDAVAGFVLTE